MASFPEALRLVIPWRNLDFEDKAYQAFLQQLGYAHNTGTVYENPLLILPKNQLCVTTPQGSSAHELRNEVVKGSGRAKK